MTSVDESGRLLDELAIRSLIARYADAVNRRDRDAWADTWAEDGVWHLPGSEIAGRDAVAAAWSSAMEGFRFVFHLVHSGAVAVDGDRATGSWTLSELTGTADNTRGMLIALYDDEYRRTDEGWRIARRRLHVLYTGPPDLSGRAFPPPAA